MVEFKQYGFAQLTTKRLYQVLQLRNEVFIVEQDAPYLDLDDKDFSAQHFLAIQNNTVVAYGRVMFDADKKAMSLGRLITKASHRRQGLAQVLMQKMLAYLDIKHSHEDVIISAQTYLEKFYQSFDFITRSDVYLEDGLPHVKMTRTAKALL